MCGIAGVINWGGIENQDAIVNALNLHQQHRGPDGYALKNLGNISLGHRRLAIIDVDGGSQPMSYNNEKIWVTFNGEIYNYLELGRELQGFGYNFTTHSDTEVILAAYQEWGIDCLKKLRGMFAFALVDLEKQQIFLARDHFGIKPLVYYFKDNAIVFASEIGALKKSIPNADLSIDFSAIDEYLSLRYINAPKSVYKYIQKLKPGHFIQLGFTPGEIIQQEYWDWKVDTLADTREVNWKEETEAVLNESVFSHLRSDVPVGAFLSGGIDSTLIVDYMRRNVSGLKTFNVGFKDEQFDESPFASEVADIFKTDHYNEPILDDSLSLMNKLLDQLGEPFGDYSILPTYYASALAAKHVKVVLTGDGGDEIFGGYNSYVRYINKLNTPQIKLSRLKRMLYPFARKLFPQRFPLALYPEPTLKNWIGFNEYFNLESRQKLWKKEVFDEMVQNEYGGTKSCFSHNQVSNLKQAQYTDFKTFMSADVLTKVDIASMANSIETRTPFLDTKVVEFASKMPEKVYFDLNNKEFSQTKIVLKRLLQDTVGSHLFNRKKQGFSVPLDKWLTDNSGVVKEEISQRILTASIMNYFNQDEVKKLINSDNYHLIWLLYVLANWSENG